MGWVSRCPASGRELPVYLGRGRDKEGIPDGAFSGAGWPDLPITERNRDWGHVVVVTPVGPRHRRAAERCVDLVQKAWDFSQGPFSSMEHCLHFDEDRKGPGFGRNQIIERNPGADWYFYVDADDMVKEYAFEAMNWSDSQVDMYWGVTECRTILDETYVAAIKPRSLRPVTFFDMVQFGFDGGGGFCVGHFVRGDLQRKVEWMEDPVYEDMEIFVTLMAHGTYTRLPFPLLMVDARTGSTRSPDKSRNSLREVWAKVQFFWQRNGRQPLDPDVLSFRNQCRTLKEFYGG